MINVVLSTDRMTELNIYQNQDKKCECYKCELREDCIHVNTFRRLSKNVGGLGYCIKLSDDDRPSYLKKGDSNENKNK